MPLFLWSFKHSNALTVNKPSDSVIILSQIHENKVSFGNFQIYLWKLTALIIKQDFEEFSVSESARILSDE